MAGAPDDSPDASPDTSPDDSSVRFARLDPGACVRVAPQPGSHDFDTDVADRAWERLMRGNARYHNGSILAYDAHDPGEIRAHIDEYRFHAVREQASTGVDILSVTCLVTSVGDDGVRRFMLGLRAPTTHRYGGLWEFGPAGAVDAPPGPTTLSPEDLIGEARREAREETGLEFDGDRAVLWGLLFDDAVGSVDIIVRIELDEIPLPETNWEYKGVRWASASELREWSRTRPGTLIPPARAIIERLDRDAYP